MPAPDHSPGSLADSAIADWLARLAEPVPDPGGGAAAGLVIATGAALVSMTAGYIAPAEGTSIVGAAADARAAALAAADADARMSGELVAAFRMPLDAPDRGERILDSTIRAAASSVDMVEIAADLIAPLHWLAEHGEARLAPDVAVAARLLACGIRAAAVNIRCDASSAAQFGATADTLGGLRRHEATALESASTLDALALTVTERL